MHAHSTRSCAVFAFTLGLASLAFAGSTTPTLRTVALTGDQAPGTDTEFFAFNNGLFDGLLPAMDNDGRVTFFAFLPDLDSGVWSEGASGNGTLSLVAQNGDLAPMTKPEAFFLGFTNIEVPSAPQIGNGTTLFAAITTGSPPSQQQFWIHDGTELMPFLRPGDPAPGLDGVSFQNLFARINSNGHVIVSTELNTPNANDETLWTNRDGRLELIAREGDQAPGAPNGVNYGIGQAGAGLSAFFEFSLNTDNKIAFQGDLTGAGVNANNDEALFLELNDEITMFVREGDPAPANSGEGVTFGGNSITFNVGGISFNALGQVGFVAELGGAISTTPATFSNHTGELLEIARFGTPAPGLPGENITFAGRPILNDNSRAVFTAAIEVAPIFQQPPYGVFWDHPGKPGDFSPLIMPGDPLASSNLTLFTAGPILGFTADGRVAFTGRVNDPNADFPPFAIFISEPDGSTNILVAVGDVLDVARGPATDMRIVSDIDVGPEGFNANGEIAFRLDFKDGSAGIFVARRTTLGDINNDGLVNGTDLLILLNAWGTPGPTDLDNDGTTSGSDLLILLNNWG